MAAFQAASQASSGTCPKATSWCKSFLDSVVIRHGSLFGYLIEVGELAVGVALICAAAVWLFRWRTLSYRRRIVVVAVTGLAAAIGVAMNVNFYLAGAGTYPWMIPRDGFDDGVDLGSPDAGDSSALIGVCAYTLRALRREHRQDRLIA